MWRDGDLADFGATDDLASSVSANLSLSLSLFAHVSYRVFPRRKLGAALLVDGGHVHIFGVGCGLHNLQFGRDLGSWRDQDVIFARIR